MKGSKKSLREFADAKERRESLEKQLNIKLEAIGNHSFSEEQVTGRNIENLIGSTQIPLGVAGPVLAKSEKLASRRSGLKAKSYFIPLATTEGALVASVSRGCKAVTQAGGATVYVEDMGQTRGPVFKTEGIEHGQKVKDWINSHIPQIAQITQKTSSHLKLLEVTTSMVGKNLFVRFSYQTGEAMGMNMVTIATEAAVKLIEQKTRAICISLAGNFDIDKKPAWLNFISSRGKKVWAEAILTKKVVQEILKTTPQDIVEVVYRKCLVGSAMSGSLGFNAHYANIIAAIFLATGQDPAHAVEGSLGITTAEVIPNGNLYFSIYLPALVVGTVGGGTNLPTQKEALEIMKVKSVLEYANAVAGAVLAGELSLIASLAEGTLAKSHIRLGRKNI